MVPVAVVDLALRGLDLDSARAHVQQQEETSLQELDGEEVHLVVALAAGVPSVLGLALRVKDEAVGLGGAEVEGDGAHALGVPLGQAQEGLWRLEGDGVQDGNGLALEHHVALHLHLGVHDAGQARQLQADVVVFVHHLAQQISKEVISDLYSMDGQLSVAFLFEVCCQVAHMFIQNAKQRAIRSFLDIHTP